MEHDLARSQLLAPPVRVSFGSDLEWPRRRLRDGLLLARLSHAAMGCGGSRGGGDACRRDAELVKIPTQKDLMNQMKSKKRTSDGMGGHRGRAGADREYDEREPARV